jgi:hypothetical protein
MTDHQNSSADIVERLRVWPAGYGEDTLSSTTVGRLMKEAADEIEGLRLEHKHACQEISVALATGKCPECGWSGGGVRDEGCMIAPCPRMPTVAQPTLPPIVNRAELIALLEDLASVNLSREACARQARRMTDDLIARGLGLASQPSPAATVEIARPSAWICTSRTEAFVTQDQDAVRAFMDRNNGWTVVPLYMRSALDLAAPQNSAERPPSSDAVEAGADTHSSAGNEDVRWAVNYLLEQIAAKFEAWDTFDLFRSEAAATVRSFKQRNVGSDVAISDNSAHAEPQALAMQKALEEIQKIGGPMVSRIARDALAE